ncbi:G2/mitotic-specific cyclin [Mortierella sp. AD094]|nr:G2/mitotic-specific cyclin [Mortierella sp. AD094]
MSQPISRSRSQLLPNKRPQNNENIPNGQPTVTYVKDAISSMQSSTKGKIVVTAPSAPLKKRALVEKTNNNANIANNTTATITSASGTDKENVSNNVAKNPTGKARVPMAPVKIKPASTVVPTSVPAPALAHAVQQQSRRILQEKPINQLEQQPVVVKREPIIKQEPSIKQEPFIKQEPYIKQEPSIKQEPAIKEEPFVKRELYIKQVPLTSAAKRALTSATPTIKTETILPLLEGEEDARRHEEAENLKRPRREEMIQWEDLDAFDVEDPLMVSEYSNQIFEYMQHLEDATMPDPHYMDTQKELAWKMRGVLIDWLAEVHYKFKLLPETLFLSVNLIDRFLSVRAVSLVKLQLVGVTALFIAAKYEEVMAPSVQNFIYMSDGGFSDKEILQAERYMLQALEFRLSYPSPMNFLRRISKADNYDIHSRTVAKYLMEIPLLDYNFLECPPSMISGAALCLARRMMGHNHWNENLERYSGYKEEDLIPCMERMVHFLQRPIKTNSFIFRKYATKRFLKASIFCREWVLDLMRGYDEAS